MREGERRMMHSQGPLQRPKVFNMRMSAEEWERLASLAEHYSLNAAGIVRMLVKERFDALAEPERTKPAKRSKR